jgi:hypothetical protein
MNTNITRTITTSLAAAICIALSACGGASDSPTANVEPINEPAAADQLGGAGFWTGSQLCALSTPEAVALQFGVEVEESTGADDRPQSACRWKDPDDPLALAQMSVYNTHNFTADAIGGDELLDIAGADMAAYFDNVGGAAAVTAVVGDQMLQVSFPVGTEGAREFGTAIATVWVASQS